MRRPSALADPARGATTPAARPPGARDDDERPRGARLRDALAGFDAATIATTHQFCQLVLRSLGVAGDTDAGRRRWSRTWTSWSPRWSTTSTSSASATRRTPPSQPRRGARDRRQGRRQPAHPARPRVDPPAETPAGVRVDFAVAVLAEIERRKRRLGILGYDDLLTRLAAALEDPAAPARQRMRRRWSVVMVDEFQDTDPVQWKVIERAFNGHITLVLIGDPKQAIYAFRGGDIATYLQAARDRRRAADPRHQLAQRRTAGRQPCRWCSAARQLGHEDIVVREVAAHHQGRRLAGAPSDAPFRLRVARREQFGVAAARTITIDACGHIAARPGRRHRRCWPPARRTTTAPVRAGDVAVIVEATRTRGPAARRWPRPASRPSTPATSTSSPRRRRRTGCACSRRSSSRTAPGWCARRRPRCSSARPPPSLRAGGDDLTDRIGQTLRAWADHLRARGVAAVFEAAQVAGMAERVLAWRGGEREMTDLAHLAQLLHETAHRERFGLPALLDWLREECAGARPFGRAHPAARQRRRGGADHDRVGEQGPAVPPRLPAVRLQPARLRGRGCSSTSDGARCLDIGGKAARARSQTRSARAEVAGDDIRLTYVALTRAQSQVVAWWAPSWDEGNGGISRLLRGRERHGRRCRTAQGRPATTRC